MKHLGTVPLETERLLLRGLTVADGEAVFRGWTGDPVVAEYMPWNPHTDVAMTKTWLRGVEQARAEDLRRYDWGIFQKETGLPIGSMGINFEDDDEEHPGEVGYALSRACWGKGYATEALEGMLSFLRDQVGAKHCIGKVCKTNGASMLVLERAGFQYREDGSYESFDGMRIFQSRVYWLDL